MLPLCCYGKIQVIAKIHENCIYTHTLICLISSVSAHCPMLILCFGKLTSVSNQCNMAFWLQTVNILLIWLSFHQVVFTHISIMLYHTGSSNSDPHKKHYIFPQKTSEGPHTLTSASPPWLYASFVKSWLCWYNERRGGLMKGVIKCHVRVVSHSINHNLLTIKTVRHPRALDLNHNIFMNVWFYQTEIHMQNIGFNGSKTCFCIATVIYLIQKQSVDLITLKWKVVSESFYYS